jgi:hypothetical protein
MEIALIIVLYSLIGGVVGMTSTRLFLGPMEGDGEVFAYGTIAVAVAVIWPVALVIVGAGLVLRGVQ